MKPQTILKFTCEEINCLIKQNDFTNRFYGYVEIPKDHPWFGKESEININLDTEITYNIFEDNQHWIGFRYDNDFDKVMTLCQAIALQILYLTIGPAAIARRLISEDKYIKIDITYTEELYEKHA